MKEGQDGMARQTFDPGQGWTLGRDLGEIRAKADQPQIQPKLGNKSLPGRSRSAEPSSPPCLSQLRCWHRSGIVKVFLDRCTV